MGMTLKELLTKGEGTLTAGEAKTLASQCRMDVETLYTLLEERGIKILDDEADGDTSLDVEGIMAEVESAEANSDELGLGDENEDDPAEENPADLKAAMDELLEAGGDQGICRKRFILRRCTLSGGKNLYI